MKNLDKWLHAVLIFTLIVLIGSMMGISEGTHVVFAVATTGVYIIENIIKKK